MRKLSFIVIFLLAPFYIAHAYSNAYVVGGIFGIELGDKDNIQTVLVSPDGHSIRLSEVENRFIVEVSMEGCGKRWKPEEITGWRDVNKKKGTGLGSFVYKASGQINSAEFDNALYFSKTNTKFVATFTATKKGEKVMYKILKKIKPLKSACSNAVSSPVVPQYATKPIATMPITSLPDPNIVTESQIKSFINTSVPTDAVEEKIVFAINADFARKYPDWKMRADEVISYVNQVLSKNTKKRLTIGKYLTYEVYDKDSVNGVIEALQEDPAYHYLNNANSENSYYGATLFYWISDDPKGASTASLSFSFSLGKNLDNAIIREKETESTLRRKEDFVTEIQPQDAYFQQVLKVVHEIGHSLGLAVPDWYRYKYMDMTGVRPELPDYDITTMFPSDPMINYIPSGWMFSDAQFSDLNSFIVNHNLYHQFNMHQISQMLPSRLVVRVRDANGNLISNAQVQVFGIKDTFLPFSSDASFFQLRQTEVTNSSGEVFIKNPIELMQVPPVDATFASEIVKVSKDGKYGGSYVTKVDLQRARLLENKETYFVDITLR